MKNTPNNISYIDGQIVYVSRMRSQVTNYNHSLRSDSNKYSRPLKQCVDTVSTAVVLTALRLPHAVTGY